MAQDVTSSPISKQREMLQAHGLMGMALFTASLAWQGKPGLMLAIFAFCVFLTTSVTAALSLIEGRIHEKSGDRLLKMCLPATGVFAFSATLFLAAGFPGWAVLVSLSAFALAAYRRHAINGAFNLIPATTLDFGLVGGLGSAVGGLFLIILGYAVG